MTGNICLPGSTDSNITNCDGQKERDQNLAKQSPKKFSRNIYLWRQ